MIIRTATIDDAEQLLNLQKQLDNETTFMLYEPGERKHTPEEQVRQDLPCARAEDPGSRRNCLTIQGTL